MNSCIFYEFFFGFTSKVKNEMCIPYFKNFLYSLKKYFFCEKKLTAFQVLTSSRDTL